MPAPNDDLYSVEQIHVPAQLPDIMKDYAKFIIQEQPRDIVEASYLYFKSLRETTDAKPNLERNE
jgi:hypothetical protein